MHYWLLGSSVMALIYLSAEEIHVLQKPRFAGIKTGQTVFIFCVPLNKQSSPYSVTWFKDEKNKQLKNNDRINIAQNHDKVKYYITIKKVKTEDSGIYYCKMNDTHGPGTALQVFRHTDPQTILMRSRVKDVFIFLQGLLLILCIAVPLFQYYRLEKKEDAVYEEPEDNHIYEGLEIEQCGGADLYEDITALARDTDAEWEVESPDQE